MTSPPERITVACPKCGTRYDDWWRPSINLTLEEFSDEYLDEASSSTCPTCGHKVQHDALTVSTDGMFELDAAEGDPVGTEDSQFSLRFDACEIPTWADQYSYGLGDDLPEGIGTSARERGWLTREDFLALCEWKTARSKSKCQRNTDQLIEEATRIALSTSLEELRIGTLTLLHGVSWATASVILHFCHDEPYPLLDRRALWSLGLEKPPAQYTSDFWWSYVQCCRSLADGIQATMRTLDRALWQYAKANQPPM